MLLAAKIEDLSANIAEDEAEFKKATGIREKEAAAFAAKDKELKEVIDMLQRAVSIQKEMAGGASMMQLKSDTNFEQALSSMAKASVISSADASRLIARVQTLSDFDAGAPAADVYANRSGGIVVSLSGLLQKAEGQLDAATEAETQAKNEYDQKKQALLDEVKYAHKDMDATKKGLAESGETKAAAEGGPPRPSMRT